MERKSFIARFFAFQERMRHNIPVRIIMTQFMAGIWNSVLSLVHFKLDSQVL
jgi:hypothetical protein